MLKWFNKNKEKKNKGFTLVELIIVVAILAILVGLLAPQYTKYVEKSRKSADASNLEEMVKAFQVACADLESGVGNGTYVISLGEESSLTKDTKPVNAGDALFDHMSETLGADWTKSSLKSNNWQGTIKGEDGSTSTGHITAITATCLVKDGVVTVTYNPTTLKDTISSNN